MANKNIVQKFGNKYCIYNIVAWKMYINTCGMSVELYGVLHSLQKCKFNENIWYCRPITNLYPL
jgi:hypothetical protein